MNTHKNARLTFLRRLEMVQDMTERGLSPAEAGDKPGVSAVTARKWHGRYLADGAAALMDKSSRPSRSPRAIDARIALTIVELGASCSCKRGLPRTWACPKPRSAVCCEGQDFRA